MTNDEDGIKNKYLYSLEAITGHTKVNKCYSTWEIQPPNAKTLAGCHIVLVTIVYLRMNYKCLRIGILGAYFIYCIVLYSCIVLPKAAWWR